MSPSDFDQMTKDELLVFVLAKIADKMTAPSDMEWLSNQARRIKQAIADEDAVSNTVIEEYIARVKVFDTGDDIATAQLTAGGVEAIQARELANQQIMDEISDKYREAYKMPAQLPGRTKGYRTLPKLPEGVLPPLLGTNKP